MDQPNNKISGLSLTTTLAIAFLSLSLFALIISGCIQIYSYYKTQQENISGKQQVIAQDAALSVSNYIQQKLNVMQTVVSTTNLSDSKYDKQKEVLENTFAIQSEFKQLSLLTKTGKQKIKISRLSQMGTKESYKNFLDNMLQIINDGNNFISPVYIDDSTGEPMIILAVPEKNIFGDVRSMMVAELSLKYLWDFMDQIKVGEKGYAYVVDRKGILIAYRDNARVLKQENLSNINVVSNFMKTSSDKENIDIFIFKGINNSKVVGTYVPLHTPDWAVVTEVPYGEAYRDIISNIGLSVLVILIMAIVSALSGIIIARIVSAPLINLTKTATKIAEGDMELSAKIKGAKEIITLAYAFNSMTTQLKNKADKFKTINEFLKEIISKAKEIIINLNSASKEIEAASQEQTSGANENASGITEVSTTLEELTITAKQITKNVGELVFSSEEIIKQLHENESQLLHTVSQLEDVGNISKANSQEIVELGKRSTLINEMVELIKDVANKTNILSINASIEASRSGEAGTGFSVVAAEIRELSKETISSAKNVEKAAKEIQDFLNSIIISSESESEKVVSSGKTVKSIYDNIQNVVNKINNNYTFTQKIDVSIKQQESGSNQAAETMKQMAEIARQSAETARQTLVAVKDIVNFSSELDDVIKKFKDEEDELTEDKE